MQEVTLADGVVVGNVTDEGQVRIRLADGYERTIAIPLEQVPRLRRLLAQYRVLSSEPAGNGE